MKLKAAKTLLIFLVYSLYEASGSSKHQQNGVSRGGVSSFHSRIEAMTRTVLDTASSVNKDSADVAVPIIDLDNPDEDAIIAQIANACSTFGFFQIRSHHIDLDSFRREMVRYFDQPYSTKLEWKRHQQNSRGYFDDELTKQKRDWKEGLDVGRPGSGSWKLSDHAPENACLDGFNAFPTEQQLPDFRSRVVSYFEDCAILADRLAILMAKGMGVVRTDSDSDSFLVELKNNHTSYLRMNHYPPCPENTISTDGGEPLGISPHRDAGFLTILIQDDDCHSLQVWYKNQWITVHPEKGALTINTGDMAMIWSNGKYKAPLHRVLTDPTKERYSAPFFYNPGYATWVAPASTRSNQEEEIVYEPCLWGYFRAVRFAGDLTDLGVEIQTEDYLRAKQNAHLDRQRIFAARANLHEPFSVEKYRSLLVDENPHLVE